LAWILAHTNWSLPLEKKIQAILAIPRPKIIKELRSFIGAVTFYRDMFPKHSHLLAPLTSQVGQRNIKWTPECESSFNAIKALLSNDAFLWYRDHNKPFHVYTDASAYQLGSVIMQDGKPVAFFSRKLNSRENLIPLSEITPLVKKSCSALLRLFVNIAQCCWAVPNFTSIQITKI
jgi:hypothetical protein